MIWPSSGMTFLTPMIMCSRQQNGPPARRAGGTGTPSVVRRGYKPWRFRGTAGGMLGLVRHQPRQCSWINRFLLAARGLGSTKSQRNIPPARPGCSASTATRSRAWCIPTWRMLGSGLTRIFAAFGWDWEISWTCWPQDGTTDGIIPQSTRLTRDYGAGQLKYGRGLRRARNAPYILGHIPTNRPLFQARCLMNVKDSGSPAVSTLMAQSSRNRTSTREGTEPDGLIGSRYSTKTTRQTIPCI